MQRFPGFLHAYAVHCGRLLHRLFETALRYLKVVLLSHLPQPEVLRRRSETSKAAEGENQLPHRIKALRERWSVMQKWFTDRSGGTTIGMSSIKKRRLEELRLTGHPDLLAGNCVPFYFCPRSVMLYLIYRGNDPDLAYQQEQQPILHLQAELRQTVAGATQQRVRWWLDSRRRLV